MLSLNDNYCKLALLSEKATPFPEEMQYFSKKFPSICTEPPVSGGDLRDVLPALEAVPDDDDGAVEVPVCNDGGAGAAVPDGQHEPVPAEVQSQPGREPHRPEAVVLRQPAEAVGAEGLRQPAGAE